MRLILLILAASVLLGATTAYGATQVAQHRHNVTYTPGGLDSYGGHHCWTRCGSYGMYRGQYHCHRSTAACRRSKSRHRAHGH